MTLRTFKRSFDWSNQEAFHTNEIAMSGGSTRMHNNLGMYYADLKRIDQALDRYQKAIDWPGAPSLPQPHHNRAQIYLWRGQWELGINEIKLALQKDPRFIYSLRLLAQVWEVLGQGERLRFVQLTFWRPKKWRKKKQFLSALKAIRQSVDTSIKNA